MPASEFLPVVTMRALALILCAAAPLSACMSTYQPAQGRQSAQFAAAQENNSTSTTLRNVYAQAFADEGCAASPDGTRLVSKMGNSDSARTDATPIAVGQPFVFSVFYMDARFGENRKCGVTGSFTPQPNRSYLGRISVKDEVRQCSLGVYDITSGTEERVDFNMPAYVCEGRDDSRRPNGRPLWTHWDITVQPAR